jgi:DNA-binding CsgD family transcriptional regulator
MALTFAMSKSIRDLAARLEEAGTFSAIGSALLDAVRDEIHPSSVHICPLYQGANLALDPVGWSEHHPVAYMKRRAMEEWPRAEQEFGPVTSYFDLPGGVVDFNAYLGTARLERTATFNDYFRDCKIERQVMAMLGSSESPLGFICIARSLTEPPFAPKELARLAEIRAQGVPALARVSNQSSSIGILTTALGVAAKLSSAYLALLTGAGQVVWMCDDAAADLGLRTWQTGKASIIPMAHPQVVEWGNVIGEANTTGAPSLSRGGLTVQRLGADNDQRALFLVIDGARHLPDAPSPAWNALTRREREIAERLATGHSVANLAAGLGISPGTIRNHIKHIYRKLGVSSRVELAIRAGAMRGT